MCAFACACLVLVFGQASLPFDSITQNMYIKGYNGYDKLADKMLLFTK